MHKLKVAIYSLAVAFALATVPVATGALAAPGSKSGKVQKKKNKKRGKLKKGLAKKKGKGKGKKAAYKKRGKHARKAA